MDKALWNMQSSSTVAVNTIVDKVNRSVVVRFSCCHERVKHSQRSSSRSLDAAEAPDFY
jgi:hypothetical protein